MRYIVTGGTGFVGSSLTQALLERGDEVIVVSRSKHQAQASEARRGKLSYATWQDLDAQPDQFGVVDGIVNLAGETVNQRWTAAAKSRILGSRLKAAEQVARLAAALPSRPSVVVNASGISGYRMSLSETYDERSPNTGTDFLADVVRQWEAAADRITATDRLVKLRVGLVIAARGGAFPLIALPYRLFAGGPIGSGKQWMSWIHLHDLVGLILHCLDHDHMIGPVNGVGPDPVTNDRFGRALGTAMHRPHWFPVPSFVLKTMLGEMSQLVLGGQRVLPHAALEGGYQFRYPTLEAALKKICGR